MSQTAIMTTEQKCRKIYDILRDKPEHKSDPKCKIFTNLGKFGIQMVCKKDDSPRLLDYVHFSMDLTEFLPNEMLFWKELREGEYEKTVDSLLTALQS